MTRERITGPRARRHRRSPARTGAIDLLRLGDPAVTGECITGLALVARHGRASRCRHLDLLRRGDPAVTRECITGLALVVIIVPPSHAPGCCFDVETRQ